MNHLRKLLLVVAWGASVLAASAWAQVGSQIFIPGQPVQPAPVGPPAQTFGEVITGENIGFQRVMQRPHKDNVIVGKLMVRIDGQWFETASPLSIVKVSK